jgi:SAM-dependent methyltransferase
MPKDLVDGVVEYYERKLAAFGPTARGMDWKDEASQAKRFAQLLRALPVSGRFTMLDYGCGSGALLPFLREGGYDVGYTGYDRSERMIAEARRLHPGATFTTDWNSVASPDYVVASGVFNVRLDTPDDTWRAYVLRTLAAVDGKAVHGWAANFLTADADEHRKRPDLHYADPAALFDWCRRSSRWVCLLHDYDLWEFTVGVTRRPR